MIYIKVISILAQVNKHYLKMVPFINLILRVNLLEYLNLKKIIDWRQQVLSKKIV